MMDLKKLKDPFPHSAVSWRIQGKPVDRNGVAYGMALAYIDARDVQDRLDEICGPENWQTEFSETARGRVICRLSIRIGDTWITKSDGAGDTDVEGEKGAISDALKRAAVSWGIGRYLYASKTPWVRCELNTKGAWKRWIDDPAKGAGLASPPDELPKPSLEDEIKWFTENLPNVKDADGINQLLGRSKQAGREVQKLVVARANTLGLSYDEQERCYVKLSQLSPAEAQEGEAINAALDDMMRDRLDH